MNERKHPKRFHSAFGSVLLLMVFAGAAGAQGSSIYIYPLKNQSQERLSFCVDLVDELQGKVAYFVIDGFHTLAREWTSIFNPLPTSTICACALLLLLVIANWRWITLVFPIWMLLVSIDILLTDLRSSESGVFTAPSHQA
jgi:hypothetical protein